MGSFKNSMQVLISAILISSCMQFFKVQAIDDRKVHVVYMGAKVEENLVSTSQHLAILQQVIHGSTPNEALVRSYTRSFNGFAAKLTTKESDTLKGMPEVVSVFPSRTLQLQTTRSWDFIGLPQPAQDPPHIPDNNMILGVLDTGIWPESPSFSDEGFGPLPKKWKGVCEGGKNFTCNKKIIGARAYGPTNTARDMDGHGSHTSSIAAGRLVPNTSFYGLANGSARGGAPFARIAVYQVCGSSGCADHDILAAFNDAIADGVDLITISIGGQPAEFDSDVIAIGAFHAMDKGILTVQSAGNSGNSSRSVGSVAPWLFTVAASSTDRKMIDKIVLGNGKTLIGNSINTFVMKGDKFPLIYLNGTLKFKNSMEGKIVVVKSSEEFDSVADAAGAVSRESQDDVNYVLPLPALMLYQDKYDALAAYMDSTKNPVATILRTETINDTNAPVVVSFSSRGPNPMSYDILKPDITAPGVDILAAYSPIASISQFNSDTRKVKYNVLSGTSMACPHVSGAATYLKGLHPDWSPAAIKSALMTTARPMSPKKNPDGEFAYGAGHLNPVAAANPGLVYETTRDDYIPYMCKMNYTTERIRKITGNNSASCPSMSNDDLSPIDLNYPAMTKAIEYVEPFKVEFSRTVTNVGVAKSTYTAKIASISSNIKVTIEPNTLIFTALKEQKSFNVSVVGEGIKITSELPGTASLLWSDGVHNVRSPIILYKQT